MCENIVIDVHTSIFRSDITLETSIFTIYIHVHVPLCRNAVITAIIILTLAMSTCIQYYTAASVSICHAVLYYVTFLLIQLLPPGIPFEGVKAVGCAP